MANRCLNCNAINSIAHIVSRACDGNYITYPNGQESEGYLPNIPGLCDSDGLTVAICIACGRLNGLDLVSLREILSKGHDDQE